MCHYETFSIMCLSLFQIQNLCQLWKKGDFLKKTSIQDFHSCFLVFSYHLKSKFGMYFAQPSFCIFEWCGLYCGRNLQPPVWNRINAYTKRTLELGKDPIVETVIWQIASFFMRSHFLQF